MTVDPTENSGYKFRCAGLPTGASGSGSGRIDLRVALYILSSKSQHSFHETIIISLTGPVCHRPGALHLALRIYHHVYLDQGI
jgi:hypothetical protein